METSRPWYKEFWPWFVMVFPLTAVIGGIMTYYVAATNNDGVVEDDYYKQGMSINRTLSRDRAAAAMGLSAKLSVGGGEVTLALAGKVQQWPEKLRLRILHPTRAGMDQTVLQSMQANGLYAGTCRLSSTNKWDVLLEDEQKTWRLAGHIEAGSSEAALAPVQ